MNSCPQGFNTPYILGREGCVECLTKVCLVPAVSNEIGEWFPYFLDELESIKIEHMKLVRTTMLECYHAIGGRINKEFKDKKKADTYGEKIMHEASKRLKISESYLSALGLTPGSRARLGLDLARAQRTLVDLHRDAALEAVDADAEVDE